MTRLGEWLYAVWAKRHPVPLPQNDHDPLTCPECRAYLDDLSLA